MPVLEKHNPGDSALIHAVWRGKAGRAPSRVRVVLDFLQQQMAADPRFGPAA